MRSHDSIGAFSDCLPDWTQGLRHSQCSRWHTQNAVCHCPVADQSYPLFGLSLRVSILPHFEHLLWVCLTDTWTERTYVKIKYRLTLLIHKTICCLMRNWSFLCSVISQGKVVALVRWGGKWNHLSITHRLTSIYAKNNCNRTLIVKVIIENVVTCFFGTQWEVAQGHCEWHTTLQYLIDFQLGVTCTVCKILIEKQALSTLHLPVMSHLHWVFTMLCISN